MLQAQLQETQQELKEAAQQHRDDLAAFQKDKLDLQKQVPFFYLPHSPSFLLPSTDSGIWVLLLDLGRTEIGHRTKCRVEGCSELSMYL